MCKNINNAILLTFYENCNRCNYCYDNTCVELVSRHGDYSPYLLHSTCPRPWTVLRPSRQFDCASSPENLPDNSGGLRCQTDGLYPRLRLPDSPPAHCPVVLPEDCPQRCCGGALRAVRGPVSVWHRPVHLVGAAHLTCRFASSSRPPHSSEGLQVCGTVNAQE